MNYFTNKILLFALALLIYIPVAVSAVEKREHAIIEGYFPEYDTLKVKFTIFKNGISTVAEGATTREISSTNGHFKMRLPVKGAVTVGVEVSADGRIKHAFMTWGKYSTTTLLIEEGDSVLIRRDPNTEGWEHNSLLFSGRGSEKMTAVKDLINKRIAYISRFDKEHPMGLEDGIDWMDTLRILTIEEINRYGESLSPYARTYLQTEVFEGLTNAASLYRALIERGREDTLVRRLYYERIVKQPFIRDPEDFDILRSSIYKATLRDKALLDYMMETGIAFTDSYGKEHREEWYHALESAYTGTLRDNLLAYYLIAYSRKRGFEQDMQLKSCVELFLATTNRQSTYHQIVGDIYDLFASKLLPGRDVPDISLQDTLGNLVRLSDFKGKVIVLDFWFTGCPGCKSITPFMEAVEQKLKKESDVVFISVCIDKEVADWQNGIGIYSSAGAFPLYTEGKQKDHPIIKEFGIYAYPTIVLIDNEGKLISARGPNPRLDNGEALVDTIEVALKKS